MEGRIHAFHGVTAVFSTVPGAEDAVTNKIHFPAFVEALSAASRQRKPRGCQEVLTEREEGLFNRVERECQGGRTETRLTNLMCNHLQLQTNQKEGMALP